MNFGNCFRMPRWLRLNEKRDLKNFKKLKKKQKNTKYKITSITYKCHRKNYWTLITSKKNHTVQTLNFYYEVILEIKRFRKCRKITTQKLYPLSFRISLSKRTKNRKIWNISDYKGVALRLSSKVGIFLSEIRGKFLRIQPLKIRSSGWLTWWNFFRSIKFVTSLKIKVANLHSMIMEIFS